MIQRFSNFFSGWAHLQTKFRYGTLQLIPRGTQTKFPIDNQINNIKVTNSIPARNCAYNVICINTVKIRIYYDTNFFYRIQNETK